jgi:NADH dehydrogenase (ubiquinone) 1 alpha subcomplex subunit 9
MHSTITDGWRLIKRIARQGCTVIVPFREEMAKRHLKVAGDLGRVIFMVRTLTLFKATLLLTSV